MEDLHAEKYFWILSRPRSLIAYIYSAHTYLLYPIKSNQILMVIIRKSVPEKSWSFWRTWGRNGKVDFLISIILNIKTIGEIQMEKFCFSSCNSTKFRIDFYGQSFYFFIQFFSFYSSFFFFSRNNSVWKCTHLNQSARFS